MYRNRKSGILLHPTSLPGPGGIGSLGDNARAFIDFLHASGQSLWQILPLGPTAYGNSPYACYSAFAGNPLLVNLEEIVAQGDLDPGCAWSDLPDDRVDYMLVQEHKSRALKKAAENFFAGAGRERREEFESFRESSLWLKDYALFMALKAHHKGKCWNEWPEALRQRDPQALNAIPGDICRSVEAEYYMQWQFFRQWSNVKNYAAEKGVAIVGDIPIFVAYDSADVWSHPHLFHLDQNGRPTVVAGVPPDYFSKTGQLWGNPLYDWDAMARDGYEWWAARFKASLALFAQVRVDHFRGFEAYWEVPAGEKTAVKGRWVKGPGDALFHALEDAIGAMPIIAEDLGVITPEVEALRDKFSFPGMKILQFAFGSGPDNPYLPHNHDIKSVVYTGTHDNDTTVGWFCSISENERKRVCRYLDVSGEDISWHMIRAAFASVAEAAIVPLQDILSLGGEARMNTPGTSSGNWTWRFSSKELHPGIAGRLHEMADMYGRSTNHW